MPLIQKKSKKAFEHNIKAEMESGKPQKQALAIAFSVKRKPHKMAKGGEAKPDLSEYIKHSDADYAAQEKGDAAGKGLQSIRHQHDTLESARHAHASANPDAKKHYAEADMHYKKAEAAYKKAKSPKKMAEGGRVQAEPKKGPSMVKSDAFSSKLRDQEEHLESSMPPKDETGPEIEMDEREAMDGHFAEGGPVADRTKGKEMSEGAMKGGSLADMWHGITHPKYAAGGEITERAEELDSQEPIHEQHYSSEEEALDHASSIVAGVMAHRRKMADGGQVDIESNNMEQPNAYYDANEAALKENTDSEFRFMSQLEDSNEDGREISADPHEKDMLSEIRAKMKRRLK